MHPQTRLWIARNIAARRKHLGRRDGAHAWSIVLVRRDTGDELSFVHYTMNDAPPSRLALVESIALDLGGAHTAKIESFLGADRGRRLAADARATLANGPGGYGDEERGPPIDLERFVGRAAVVARARGREVGRETAEREGDRARLWGQSEFEQIELGEMDEDLYAALLAVADRRWIPRARLRAMTLALWRAWIVGFNEGVRDVQPRARAWDGGEETFANGTDWRNAYDRWDNPAPRIDLADFTRRAELLVHEDGRRQGREAAQDDPDGVRTMGRYERSHFGLGDFYNDAACLGRMEESGRITRDEADRLQATLWGEWVDGFNAGVREVVPGAREAGED